MVERNISGAELVAFMDKVGITFYGLSTAFGFTQQTCYRWKKRLAQDPDATLNSQFMCARVVKMEIGVLDQFDEEQKAKGCGFYEALLSVPATDRPQVIRQKLDELIYK